MYLVVDVVVPAACVTCAKNDRISVDCLVHLACFGILAIFTPHQAECALVQTAAHSCGELRIVMSDRRWSGTRAISDVSSLQSDAKRQRTCPSVVQWSVPDCEMAETGSQGEPLSSMTSILDIPTICLRRIMMCVTTIDPQNPVAHSALSPQTTLLARNFYLRETCRAFRAAYDSHVTSFDFSGLSISCVELVLRQILPRFRCLGQITLTPTSTDRALAQSWMNYLSFAQMQGIAIRALNFVDAATLTTAPAIIVAGCKTHLEKVQVATMHPNSSVSILSSIAQHCPAVRSVDVMLDDVDSRVLAGVSGLSVLRALFRVS